MNDAFHLLQKYCGVAVGRNQRNLMDMRKAVWATFLHIASVDSSPHIGALYRLRFMVWLPESKDKCKKLLL